MTRVTTTEDAAPVKAQQYILMEPVDWNLANSDYQGMCTERVHSIPSNDYTKLQGRCAPATPSASTLDIMQCILNASGSPALCVEVCVGICQVISRNCARCTGTLRPARFVDVANLGEVQENCFE